MILADYDNGLFYVYEGSNNGHLYTFIGYTIEEDGNYRGYCESRLTRNEIRALHDGKKFLNKLDSLESALRYALEEHDMCEYRRVSDELLELEYLE